MGNSSEKHIIEGKKSDRQTLDIDLITFANSFPPSIDCFCLFSGRLLKCLEINFLLFLFILTVSPNLEKKTQTKETSLIYLNLLLSISCTPHKPSAQMFFFFT